MSDILTDNLGYVAIFVIGLLVLLIFIGIVTGKIPDIFDAIRSALGIG
jgi:hypothetical protein